MATKDYYQEELSIAEFELSERFYEPFSGEGEAYHSLWVFQILEIRSTESAEECRKLLRTILNTWINLQLHQRGIIFNGPKVRKEIIQHHSMADYKWHYLLQDIAHLYHRYEGRHRIKAEFSVGGGKWLEFY